MGASSSIELKDSGGGIYTITDTTYPIAYIRLYHDKTNNKFCIAVDCDSALEKRNFIVVGMRLHVLYPDLFKPDEIHEQVFYTTSGSNSIEHFNMFISSIDDVAKIDIDIDYSLYSSMSDADKLKQTICWLPFSGLGYDLEKKGIKLIKDNYCIERDENCKFGRFGKNVPNLMQISYCLGGILWDKYFDMFKEHFGIEKLPTLKRFIDNIDCYYIDSNVDCNINMNKYIGSAIYLNYDPAVQNFIKNSRFIIPYNEFKHIKFDYNIIYNILSFISKPRDTFKLSFHKGLPVEYKTFYYPSFVGSYYSAIKKIKDADPVYYKTHILSNSTEDLMSMTVVKNEIENIMKQKKGSLKVLGK